MAFPRRAFEGPDVPLSQPQCGTKAPFWADPGAFTFALGGTNRTHGHFFAVFGEKWLISAIFFATFIHFLGGQLLANFSRLQLCININFQPFFVNFWWGL